METMKENEIVLYQPNETIKLEVRVENDSVWLNQTQMSVLFGTGRQAITKHIKNIYACGELQKEATCSILELVRLEGSSSHVIPTLACAAHGIYGCAPRNPPALI